MEFKKKKDYMEFKHKVDERIIPLYYIFTKSNHTWNYNYVKILIYKYVLGWKIVLIYYIIGLTENKSGFPVLTSFFLKQNIHHTNDKISWVIRLDNHKGTVQLTHSNIEFDERASKARRCAIAFADLLTWRIDKNTEISKHI